MEPFAYGLRSDNAATPSYGTPVQTDTPNKLLGMKVAPIKSPVGQMRARMRACTSARMASQPLIIARRAGVSPWFIYNTAAIRTAVERATEEHSHTATRSSAGRRRRWCARWPS